MSPIIYTILECLRKLGGAAVQWFDDTSLATLLIVAGVFSFAACRLPQSHTGLGPPACSGVFLLAYFLHRYLIDGDQCEQLVASLLRSLLASHIVWSVAELIVLAFQAFWQRLKRLWSSLRRMALAFVLKVGDVCRRLCQSLLKRKPPPPKPAPPALSRAAALRKRAEAAHADYEAEIAALAGLPLDEDETADALGPSQTTTA